MNRVLLADGEAHEISCAVLKDGISSPAVELLDLLERNMWPDPKVSELPDARQANAKRRFLAQVNHLAEFGELEPGFNRLKDGVWELKFWALRITFFDTNGDGTYSPKYGSDNYDWSGTNQPELPIFDDFIRIGHYFGKNSPQTSPSDIYRSLKVREEDLSHDCN